MKWKNFVLLLLFAGLVGGCIPDTGINVKKDHNWLMENNAVYQRATPENQDRILRGRIGEGMTIDECMVSWNKHDFKLVNSRSSGYQLWFVRGMAEYNYYLHVQDGVVIEVSQRRKIY